MADNERDPRYLTSIRPEGDENEEIDGSSSFDYQRYIWNELQRDNGIGNGFTLLDGNIQRDDWFVSDFPKWQNLGDGHKWVFKNKFRPNFIFGQREGTTKTYVIWIVKKAWMNGERYRYCLGKEEEIEASETKINVENPDYDSTYVENSRFVIVEAPNLDNLRDRANDKAINHYAPRLAEAVPTGSSIWIRSINFVLTGRRDRVLAIHDLDFVEAIETHQP